MVVVAKLTLLYFYLDIPHHSITDNVYFFGYQSGKVDSIHSFDVWETIGKSKRCHKLHECGLMNVKLSKQYFEDNPQKRFPPSYYLPEGETKRIANLFEKLTSPSTRILTAYDPIKHLKVLGFKGKDFDDCSISEDATFENTVTILSPEKSLIVLNVVVDGSDPDDVKEQLRKCNEMMKAVYLANHENISKQHVTIVGTIILSSISTNQLTTTSFPFLNFLDGKYSANEKAIFVCKEQVDTKVSLQKWLNDVCKKTSNQSQRNSSVCDVAEEMMVSMSIKSSYLPKLTCLLYTSPSPRDS